MKAIAGILSLILAFVAPAVAQDKLFTNAKTAAKTSTTGGQSLIVSNIKTANGYRQVIRVANAPRLTVAEKIASDAQALNIRGGAGNPERLECVSTVTVTPLGNEITYGASGPQVPTRLFAQIGNAAPVPLYPGTAPFVPLSPQNPNVQSVELQLQANETIRFIAESAYPDFESPDPVVNYSIGSDDEVNAAVLTHQDNFYTVAAAKGINAPFGMQVGLEEILGNMVNWTDGSMQLSPEEMIVLFELGALSPQSAAFDFNDLVLHIRSQCANGSEVVLRDSIGTNPQDVNGTNGNFNFTAFQGGASGEYNFIPTTVSPTEPVRLTEISGVFARNGSTPVNFSAFDFEIRIWTSHAAVLATPSNGNFVPDIQFSTPTSNVEWGTSVNFGNPRPAWKFTFDISSANVVLEPGQTYIIGIVPRRFGSSVDGAIGMVESRQSGESDLSYGEAMPGGFQPVSELFGSQYYGRVGLKVVGVSN